MYTHRCAHSHKPALPLWCLNLGSPVRTLSGALLCCLLSGSAHGFGERKFLSPLFMVFREALHRDVDWLSGHGRGCWVVSELEVSHQDERLSNVWWGQSCVQQTSILYCSDATISSSQVLSLDCCQAWNPMASCHVIALWLPTEEHFPVQSQYD